MASNNPVFRNSDEFSKSSGYSSDPSTWGVGQPGATIGYGVPPTHTVASTRMTIDSVVQKASITLGIVILTAIATWALTPGVLDAKGNGALYAAGAIGSIGAFVLSLVNSFRRQVSPALVMVFAAFEGVALGALSKIFDASYGHGVVTGAVVGTFLAFAGTLSAYKFLNIKVGHKFQVFMTAAVLGVVGLSLVELVLSLFNAQVGLFGNGPLGLVFAIVGLVLGVFMLIQDFDFVERGVANGLDERYSWYAAFALTVSLVWIYTNLLRLLSILRSN